MDLLLIKKLKHFYRHTPVGISKSTGLGLISIVEGISELNPDLALLGDRFKSLASVTAAMIARIYIVTFMEVNQLKA